MNRWTNLALAVALTALPAMGCQAARDAATTEHPCSPSYIDSNEFGRISAQQAKAGADVLWGVQPNVPFERIVVRVYAGSRKVDGKNQSYEAHGVVPAQQIRKAGSGSIFRIEGETYDASGNATGFFLRCRLA